jgi:small subunit ribosomal protein S10
MTVQIAIVVKHFFKQPLKGGPFSRLKAARIGLPQKRILYTVLRSPHIDKKSREQFEMRINKHRYEITTTHQNARTLITNFLLHPLPGIQAKIILHYKTRIPNENKSQTYSNRT